MDLQYAAFNANSCVVLRQSEENAGGTRADSGEGYGGCNPPPQMILRSPAHLGLKYESRPVFLTGP